MLDRYKESTSELRRARTRTLIQLGGLIEKSGLLEQLNIQLGDDLQKDETKFEKASILLGALDELKRESFHDTHQQMIWKERGKNLISKDHLTHNKNEPSDIFKNTINNNDTTMEEDHRDAQTA